VTPESIAAANRQVFRHVMLAALQAEGYSRERAESVLFWNWLGAQHAAVPLAPERQPTREQAR
jgi:hypothetical protein